MTARVPVTPLTLLMALVCAACSSSAALYTILSTVRYPDKLKLRALVYIPSEIHTKQISTRPESVACYMYWVKIEAGAGLVSAIQSGLEAALERVEIVSTIPTPEIAQQKGANLIVLLNQYREYYVVRFEGVNAEDLYSQFECAMDIQFANVQGDSIHSFTTFGYSSARGNGGCGDMAPRLRQTMESSLFIVTDSIARATYTADPIREYEKSASTK